MSEPMNIDPEDLTLREVDELETLLGTGIDTAFGAGQPKAMAIAAIVWITKRRENPELALDDVLDMNLRDVNLGGVEDETPVGKD